ncbi:MAG TPA: SDR family oxidoreductase [Dictyobacter sp.]|nr:SDR family oxidoreductase [Dictyobacter sp.]
MSGTAPKKTAIVTGGSRGIGAATTLALADRGYDVAITYRNKAVRAQDVVSQVEQRGHSSLAVSCDITDATDLEQFFTQFTSHYDHLDALILNASGGLERDLLAADPDYPMHINRDAQVALVERALPLMRDGGVIVFVTSHWAHLYGRIEQVPAYAPVAESKYAGEQALRARLPELAARNVRLVVVTGDLIAGTITPKLLERAAPGLSAHRTNQVGGQLPTADEMGEIIAQSAVSDFPSGHVVIVGGSLESLVTA